MAKKNQKKFVSIDFNELSHQSETLLANIRFASVDEPVKTIVITSTGVDEGKTTTAIALAVAMARSGKRTLIVDCDMRRRSVGRVLGMRTNAGIYAVLSGRVPLKRAVTQTAQPNLYLLDCEPNVANPSDMLSTKRFAALMATLRNAFDYVVIDTPPLSLFVDAAVVSTLADGVALVVRQRMAKKRAVADALSQLDAANARVLGLVLTFAQKGDDDYYYYYYYNEENKRIKKKRAHAAGDDASEQEAPVPASRREFDEDNVVEWARRVGVSVEAAQEQMQAPAGRRVSPRASHSTEKLGAVGAAGGANAASAAGAAVGAAGAAAAGSARTRANAAAGAKSAVSANAAGGAAKSENPFAPGAFKK